MTEKDNPRRSRRSSGAITLRDVAKLAGVAPITASRVMNTPDQVSPEVRQRVANALLAAALVPLGPLYAERPVGCQVDVSEFDPVACVYQNSLDDAAQGSPALQSRHSAGMPL